MTCVDPSRWPTAYGLSASPAFLALPDMLLDCSIAQISSHSDDPCSRRAHRRHRLGIDGASAFLVQRFAQDRSAVDFRQVLEHSRCHDLTCDSAEDRLRDLEVWE